MDVKRLKGRLAEATQKDVERRRRAKERDDRNYPCCIRCGDPTGLGDYCDHCWDHPAVIAMENFG